MKFKLITSQIRIMIEPDLEALIFYFPALLLVKVRLTSDHEVCQFHFYCSTVFLVKQRIKEIYYLERNCEFTFKNILFMS